MLEHRGPLLAELLNALTRENDLAFFETLLRYAMSVDEAIEVDDLKRVVSTSVSRETGDIVMSLAERLIAEGEAKGKAEGEARLVQKLLKLKFPDASPVELQGLTLEQLDTIGARILTCNTLEEVFEGMPL